VNSSTGSGWRTLRWPLAALGLLLVFNLLATPGFFRFELKDGRLYGSLIDILYRAAPIMLVSLGMTLVIATGGVDLSVGAIMAIAGAVGALLLNSGCPLALVLAGALGCATLAGLWNGALVGPLQIPPIVATLILMVSGRGVAQLLTQGQIVTFENKAFEFVGRGHLLGLPFPIFLVAAGFVLLRWLLSRTAAGLFIEACGDNELASRYAGVPTRLVKLMVYGISGWCAGWAGLIVATDIKGADANNAGLYLELDAILAVVIGGTALSGGRAHLAGSLLGAALIQTLTTTIFTRGLTAHFTLLVKSAVIIGVCLLQAPRFRKLMLRASAGAPR